MEAPLRTPAALARGAFSILRIIAEGDQVASEVRIEIDGRTDYAVSFYELRDGKIIKETDYWPEPYEAPAWRAQWVEKIELTSN